MDQVLIIRWFTNLGESMNGWMDICVRYHVLRLPLNQSEVVPTGTQMH